MRKRKMIRGKFKTKGLSIKALNTIELTTADVEVRTTKWKPEFRKPLESFHKVIEGNPITVWEKENDILRSSKDFREKVLEERFEILFLYPCYYQGWECDEWGAIGIKNGRYYRLETNHSSLNAEFVYG